jgi:hypothetical protein
MAKLPMPAGLLIEAAFANGINGDSFIEILRNRDLQALKYIGKEDASWLYLFQYAEDNWTSIVEAVFEGYTYKFISIRGLFNLIQTKYSLAESDILMSDSKIQFNVNDDQLSFLKSRVPDQWLFQNGDSGYQFEAVLAQTKHTLF